jgi:Uma2 family endonuclease
MATHEIRPGSQLKLGYGDAGRLISAEEFANADYDEPWYYERVNGRLVVLAPNDHEQVETSSPWIENLIVYKAKHGEVIQYVVPDAWVRVNDETDRIGDIGVYMEGNPQVRGIPDRVPDLMFEIVGPGRTAHDRDYIEKRSEYERIGVKEYVIVDRFARRVTVLTLSPGGYRERVLTMADTYTSRLLPGLAIPLGEVFNP